MHARRILIFVIYFGVHITRNALLAKIYTTLDRVRLGLRTPCLSCIHGRRCTHSAEGAGGGSTYHISAKQVKS